MASPSAYRFSAASISACTVVARCQSSATRARRVRVARVPHRSVFDVAAARAGIGGACSDCDFTSVRHARCLSPWGALEAELVLVTTLNSWREPQPEVGREFFLVRPALAINLPSWRPAGTALAVVTAVGGAATSGGSSSPAEKSSFFTTVRNRLERVACCRDDDAQTTPPRSLAPSPPCPPIVTRLPRGGACALAANEEALSLLVTVVAPPGSMVVACAAASCWLTRKAISALRSFDPGCQERRRGPEVRRGRRFALRDW